MKIVTVDQMRRLEAASAAGGVSSDELMQHAGLAVAQLCVSLLGAIAGSKILVLVGPGNNGGDALVAARHLQRRGAEVVAFLVSSRPAHDENLASAESLGVRIISCSGDPYLSALEGFLFSSVLVIDGVLGTGRTRPLQGALQKAMLALGRARSMRNRVITLALDVPTGMDADTGATDAACAGADHTIAFGYPKLGHYRFPGSAERGDLHIVDIGIPRGLDNDIHTELLTPQRAADNLPERSPSSHKGTFGHTLVVAGSRRYVGAAYLASQGAARVGSGLVTLASPECIYPYLASKLTEVIHNPVPADAEGGFSIDAAPLIKGALEGCDALLLGCGFGSSPDLVELIKELLVQPPQPAVPVVIDADGLNNLARIDGWWKSITSQMVLTPHPGEMSTLTGVPTSHIQECREDAALEAAQRWNQTVVLKGAYTVIATPDAGLCISPFANPALASGGTGDVLAGMIAGLIAQGLPPADAACCGVYIHGAAGEALRKSMGDAGVLATDLLPLLPETMQTLRNP